MMGFSEKDLEALRRVAKRIWDAGVWVSDVAKPPDPPNPENAAYAFHAPGKDSR